MTFTKRYDNGLRVVVQNMQGLMSVTMGILVGTGACDETDAEDGISHFIEHMQFKGTQKRTAFEVSDAFDRIGAQVNAFTGKDSTVYYAKCTADHTEETFEALSDLFLNATYPEDEMAREKQVICEEISMSEDSPDDLCLDILSSAFYGEKNYGRNILGTKKQVEGFTIEDVKRYKEARYTPENIVLSFAGGITPDEAERLVEKYFSALPKGKFEQRERVIVSPALLLTKKKKIEQTHFAIAYPAVARDHALADATTALSGVLGGNMSSRLFQEVREKRGLAYSVFSFTSLVKECGALNVYAGVNPEKAEQAYEAVRDVIEDLKKNGVTDDEFSRSREQMKASVFFSNESTSSQMLLFGKYMLQRNEVFNFEDKLKRINQMKKSDLRDVIDYSFDESKKAVAIVSNTPNFLKNK